MPQKKHYCSQQKLRFISFYRNKNFSEALELIIKLQ